MEDEYIKIFNAIKHENSHTITNNYYDVHKIKEYLNSHKSKLFISNDCLCILTLQHNSFYEGLYLAKHAKSLEQSFQIFKQEYRENLPIRFMIAGKDCDTETSCQALITASCPLHKKLIRRRIVPFSNKELALLENFTEDQNIDIIQFAEIADCDEIYAMLCKEFDIYGDNIPEINIIKENIEKKQVLIIRKDNNIAFIHYFYIINKIYYDYFELTHKDYRKEPFYFLYLLYRHNYLNALNIKRLYEWRDAKNTRLLKMPLVKYYENESIYINFHLYKVKNNMDNL